MSIISGPKCFEIGKVHYPFHTHFPKLQLTCFLTRRNRSAQTAFNDKHAFLSLLPHTDTLKGLYTKIEENPPYMSTVHFGLSFSLIPTTCTFKGKSVTFLSLKCNIVELGGGTDPRIGLNGVTSTLPPPPISMRVQVYKTCESDLR